MEFSLPQTANASSALAAGTAELLDQGVGFYYGRVIVIASTVGSVVTAASPAVSVDATNPFTWVTGDIVDVAGTYEEA